ncbi:MAG: SusD/RagB family nutrient-binding outer membrane lipoprotein [Filimonas sp.]|nr:SusD/RagB family nutrient-binding outer membrane lipoprotein [Filimonas sp.]
MKNSFQKYAATFVAGAALLTSCTKNFNSINTDPSSYSQSNFDPNYLLTTSQIAYTGSFDFSYDTWRSNLIYCSTMIQGFSSVISYWAGDKYLLNEAYTASYWGFAAAQTQGQAGDGAYPEQIRVIVDAMQFAKDKPQYKNLYQITRIMRAMMIQRISDLYGDVPYSQAGFGYYTGNYFPKYDKQQDIYTDMLKEVDDATSKLDPSADKPAGDAFYGGDITKWKKFGNTLLLRLAMRLVKIDETTAKTYATKVVGQTFASNSDNAFLKHDATGGRPTVNRNGQVLTGAPENANVKWSQTFINLLKSTSDPRLSKIAVVNGNITTPALQKGMPNGKDLSGIAGRDISTDPSYTSMGDYSSANPYMLKPDAPTFILTYAESELLLAEAAQRWGIGGSAAQHYHDGVKAAITYLSQYDASAAVSDNDAETYLTANPYVPANGLNQINTQYWAHTNTMLDFYESWNNWKRSGYPVLTPVVYPNNATNGTIPRRFPYPVAEANSNPVNYKQAHDNYPGGDVLTSRVWWDKQ